jgi:hypothetical protein
MTDLSNKLLITAIIASFLVAMVLNGCGGSEVINGLPSPPQIFIQSPSNLGRYTNSVLVAFTLQTYGRFDVNGDSWGWIINSLSYSLDDRPEMSIPHYLLNDEETNRLYDQYNVSIRFYDQSVNYNENGGELTAFGSSNGTLTNLSQGEHSIVIYGEKRILMNGFLDTGESENFSSPTIHFYFNTNTSLSPSPTTPIEETISDANVPFTGIGILLTVFAIAILAVISVVFYRQHRKTSNYAQ